MMRFELTDNLPNTAVRTAGCDSTAGNRAVQRPGPNDLD